MIKVSNNGKWGCINENMIEIVPPIYDEIYFDHLDLNTDVITVKLNNKWGIFNMLGNELVAIECDEVKLRYAQFIFFKIDGKWGVKSETGKEILPTKYQEIKNLYDNDLFAVKINDKWGVITKTDQIVIPAIYDEEFDSSSDSTIIGTLKDEKILFDNRGNIIFKQSKKEYDEIELYRVKVLNSGRNCNFR